MIIMKYLTRLRIQLLEIHLILVYGYQYAIAKFLFTLDCLAPFNSNLVMLLSVGVITKVSEFKLVSTILCFYCIIDFTFQFF